MQMTETYLKCKENTTDRAMSFHRLSNLKMSVYFTNVVPGSDQRH